MSELTKKLVDRQKIIEDLSTEPHCLRCGVQHDVRKNTFDTCAVYGVTHQFHLWSTLQMTDSNIEPTHRCKICGALWHEWDYGEVEEKMVGSWTLVSCDCGECCDNQPMENQIETIGEWASRTKEQNWHDMLAKLMFENGFHPAPIKTVRHTPHFECLIPIGPDHTAKIIIDEDALKELKNRTGVV